MKSFQSTMFNRTARFPLAVLIVSFSLIAPASATDWAYTGDDAGPDKWAELDPANALCASGKNQSPVNIDTTKTLSGKLPGLKFNYGLLKPAAMRNTGKGLELTLEPGASIRIDGLEFGLKRIDFHIPSEHTVNGQHFPMEIQFIHESAGSTAKQLANVSMMAIPGKPDRTLRKLVQYLPLAPGESKPLADNALRNLEMKRKLANYYRYDGSITTPPCTEGVRWFIMKQPLTQSKAQYQAFRESIKEDNNRPVQDLIARRILEWGFFPSGLGVKPAEKKDD